MRASSLKPPLCLCHRFFRYPRPPPTLWTTAANTPGTILSLWASPLQTIPSRTKNPAIYCSGCHLAYMCFIFCLLMSLYSFCWEKWRLDCDRIITMCSPVLLTIHQFIHNVPQKQLFVKSKESVVCVAACIHCNCSPLAVPLVSLSSDH